MSERPNDISDILDQLDQYQHSRETAQPGEDDAFPSEPVRPQLHIYIMDRPLEEQLAGVLGETEVESGLQPEAQPAPPLTPTPPRRQQAHPRRLAPLALLVLLGIIGAAMMMVLFITPFFRPSASVTIIPDETTVTLSGTVPVAGRALPTVQLTQARTVPATGTGHQDARRAQGSVTFYNGYTQGQTIQAGTLLRTATGVRIATDESAYVPPASPPMQGQATVPAHALETGTAGNIRAYSIYGACCRSYILVQNTAAFTGGQDARTFLAVTQSDLDAVTSTLKPALLQSVKAAFQAQLQPGEESTPPTCAVKTASDRQAGQEGAEVTGTVTATCSAVAYRKQDAQSQAARSLTAAARQRLGDSYALTGDARIVVTDASINGATVSLSFEAQGTMVYPFSAGKLQAVRDKIAGMDKDQAIAWLIRQKGIKAVSIEVSGVSATLPQDASAIHCTLLFAAY